MFLNFQPLSMMELRHSPGKILDRVANDHEAFIVERSGIELACIVPVSTLMPDIQRDRLAKELDSLSETTYKIRINAIKQLELHFPRQGQDRAVTLVLELPHSYPNDSPRVYADPLAEECPNCWPDGSLKIYGAIELWDPSTHDVARTLTLAQQWLSRHEANLRPQMSAEGGNDGQ